MRNGFDIALRITRWVFTGLAAVALALFALIGTGPGHSALEDLLPLLSGQTVSVRGLSGDLPDTLHADEVEISDARGVWLRIEDLSLDWSALAALNNHIAIRDVRAAKITVLRQPVPEQTTESTTPIIDIGKLSVPRIEIAQAVVGHAALLSASGSLHYESVHQATADITVIRLGSADRYRVNGKIVDDIANGAVVIHEGADGILAALAGLPGLGPINMEAQAGGDRAQNAVSFVLSAGALQASGQGTVALAAREAAIDFTATAPAMQPRADLSWQSLAIDGHMRGAFDAPTIGAKLRIDNLHAFGTSASALAANITGSSGTAELDAQADDVRVPGSTPDLLASAPLVLKAHADLASPTRPIAFALMHPRINMTGSVRTKGTPIVAAAINIPSLAPFSTLAGTELDGAARFTVHVQQNRTLTVVSLDGNLHMTGNAFAARLLGGNATLTAKADLAGADAPYSTLSIRGAGLSGDVQGSLRDKALDYTVALTLPDMARLASTLNGNTTLHGRITGNTVAVDLTASGRAEIATKGFARQAVGYNLAAQGLPDPSTAQLRVTGNFDGAPVAVDGTLAKSGTSRTATLTAKWKTLAADANFHLPQNGAVTGRAKLDLKRLSDIAVFIGTKLEGSLNADIDARMNGRKSIAVVHANAADIRAGETKLDALAIGGSVADPLGKPVLDLKLAARKLDVSGFRGDASGTLNGALDRLNVALSANLRDSSNNPLRADAVATLDTKKQNVALQKFSGHLQDETLTLRAPAVIDYAGGVSVERFSAAVAGGSLTLSGHLTPKLDASVALQDVPADALQKFVPQLAATGTLSATAQLTGTLAAPQGRITVQGRGLQAEGVSQRAVSPANLDAHATLHGDSMTVNATLAAGNSANLTVTGEAPLTSTKSMALHVAGNLNLAILNPILIANGRRVRGKLTADMHIGGTYAAPRATGGGSLSNGEFQDVVQGVRLRQIAAAFQAEGNAINITQLSARAGPGTVTGKGTIDLASPGIPVNIAIEANNARPIVSDKLRLTMSGNLKLAGKLKSDVTLSGNIRVLEGDINLPDKFPPDVAVLDVRRPGQAPPPPPQPSSSIALDVTVMAPEQIFVRGHGIDAEVSGRIQITGTAADPYVGGGFTMRRGTFSIAGQTLNFTSGKVSFNGTGVRNRLDPTLDFVASTTSGGVTATLTVGGTASNPTITLSSSPQLPQDEVLAHLLFQQSVKQLSPFQLAEIAQALAALGGIGNGFSPLSAIRKGLGLDRLSVGGASDNSGQTTVEAGKYVARNVYVGAKQNLSGGTQVQVQVDITKRLKAQATLSTVTNATVTKGNAAQDNGSNVGLSYQFEY